MEPEAVSRRALLRLRFGAGARTEIDYDGVTARVRAGWEAAASEPLLRALEPVAEAAAGLVGVMAGERVLDAGAGDGNVALACVGRGADVDACDIADAMVARGRERCGDAVRWQRADLQALPYPDGSFDVVISTFGAALAPRARRTARELVRVLRPGGRVVLAAWTPESPPGRLDGYAALPDGVHPPSAWSDEATARRRFDGLLEWLERRTRTIALAPELLDVLASPLALHGEALAGLRAEFDGEELDARYALYAGRRLT
jgi:SAM-dependent methyltransferase